MKHDGKINNLNQSVIEKFEKSYCYCEIITNFFQVIEDIHILSCNKEFKKITGIIENKDNYIGICEKYKVDLIDKISKNIKSTNKEYDFEWYFNKTQKWGRLKIFIGDKKHVLITVDDVTFYKNNQLKYEYIVDKSLETIIIRELDGSILYCNSTGCDTFQYKLDEIINMNVKDLIDKAIEGYNSFFPLNTITERLYIKKDKTKFFAEEITKILKVGNKSHIVTYIIDITEKKIKEKKFKYLAYFDSLTDLPNRNFFNMELKKELEKIKKYNGNLVVMFLDLDNFKYTNDTYGHGIGDKLLCEASKRVKSVLRKDDLIARIGGDEFTILLKDIKNIDNAKNVMERMIKSFDSPVCIEKNIIINMEFSIGMSIAPRDGENVEELIKRADKNMYANKKSKKNK